MMLGICVWGHLGGPSPESPIRGGGGLGNMLGAPAPPGVAMDPGPCSGGLEAALVSRLSLPKCVSPPSWTNDLHNFLIQILLIAHI